MLISYYVYSVFLSVSMYNALFFHVTMGQCGGYGCNNTVWHFNNIILVIVIINIRNEEMKLQQFYFRITHQVVSV